MILFAIYKWKCAHLRKHWEITVWTWPAIFYPLQLDGPPAFGVLNYLFFKRFFRATFAIVTIGKSCSFQTCCRVYSVDFLWSIVTPSPKMFQDSRCCWASCCSPCWCWGTCHASRGTLVTAPMSVSATGLSTHLAVPGCHGIEFFSTYCDEYDPVEGVDGQILHYVSDRVGLQALFVWPNKTNKDV